MALKQKEIENLKIDLKLPGGDWEISFIGEHLIRKNNSLFVTIFLKPINNNTYNKVIKKQVRQNLLALLGEGCIIKHDYTLINPSEYPSSQKFRFTTQFSKAIEYEASTLIKSYYKIPLSDIIGKYYIYDNYIVPSHVIARYFFFCSTKTIDILFDSNFDQIIFPITKTDFPDKGYVIYDNNKLNKSEAQRIGQFFFDREKYGEKAFSMFKHFRKIFHFPDKSKIFLGIIPFKNKIIFEGFGRQFHFEGKQYTIIQQLISSRPFNSTEFPFVVKVLETIPLYPKGSTKEKDKKDVRSYINTIIDHSSECGTVKINNENPGTGPTNNQIINLPGYVNSDIVFRASTKNDQLYKYFRNGTIIIPGSDNNTTDDNFDGKGVNTQKINITLESIIQRGLYIKNSIHWACNELNIQYKYLNFPNNVYTFEINWLNRYVYILEKRYGPTRIVGDSGFSKLNEDEIYNVTLKFSETNQKLNSSLTKELAIAIPSILLHASIRHETDLEYSDVPTISDEMKNQVIQKAGLKIKNYLKRIFSI